MTLSELLFKLSFWIPGAIFIAVFLAGIAVPMIHHAPDTLCWACRFERWWDEYWSKEA